MNTIRRSKEALDSLRTIPLFAAVGDDDLEAIAELLIERRIPKGQTIIEEGLAGDYMYVIVEGQVKVTKLSGDGREKILGLLGPGDFFGEMSLLDNSVRAASVKSMAETRILALSRQIDEQASSLSFQRVKERTQGLLTRMATGAPGAEGRMMTPPLTHQQIADMIGTSRETVTRIVKRLKQEGWLQQQGKQYLVPESDGD